MAGIGFKLQQLFNEESYFSQFQGFSYSLALTSGPWLIMVITLAIFSRFPSVFFKSEADWLLFKIVIFHVFAFTIMITSTFQLVFIRTFADKLYTKERKELPNIILINVGLTLTVMFIFTFPIVYFAQINIVMKILILWLFLTMTIIFVLMNYMSVSEAFLTYIKHYFIGCVISFALSGSLGYLSDLSGFFLGFLIGQAYIAMLLFIYTIKIFGFPEKLNSSLLQAFQRHPALLLSGFFLGAGMWIDKFIYWYGPSRHHLYSIFYYETQYNVLFYIALLLTTPVMALFIVVMETSFYQQYYTYRKAIENKANLRQLQEACIGITQSIKNSLKTIIQIQGLIVVLSLLFSKNLLRFLEIEETLNLSFNVIVIGVFFHLLFLMICVILLYFDLRKETLSIYAAFFVLNGILTLMTIKSEANYAGIGYTISAFLMFGYSLFHLKNCLHKINYLTFARQEIREKININKETYVTETQCYGRYYIKNGKKRIDITS